LTETTPSTAPVRRKILIVDDQSTNIQVLHAALRGSHLIQFATSGQQCLELARRSQPDVILLDIYLPDLDGVEVCRRLLGDPDTAGALVALMSGSAEDEVIARGLEAGAVDFLIKPMAPELIRRRVDLLVELKSLREATAST
jgi:CheY-like chemotaxis protein